MCLSAATGPTGPQGPSGVLVNSAVYSTLLSGGDTVLIGENLPLGSPQYIGSGIAFNADDTITVTVSGTYLISFNYNFDPISNYVVTVEDASTNAQYAISGASSSSVVNGFAIITLVGGVSIKFVNRSAANVTTAAVIGQSPNSYSSSISIIRML